MDVVQPKFPINLDQVWFTRTVVVAVPNHVPSGEPFDPPENKLDVSRVEGEANKYIVKMRSTLNSSGDPKCPYIVDMECMGLFSSDGTLSEEESLRGVLVVGHSVIFGAIREAVTWITGRGPMGPLTLGLSVLEPKAKEPE